MEARDARQSNWLGRSTVRSLRPGTAFDLIGLPIDPTKADTEPPWLPGARLPITDFFVNYKLSSSRSAALMQLFDFQNRIICIM